MNNFYSILGLAKTATFEEIKQSYRKLAMQHHPDRGGDEKKFKEIAEAYSILSNPESRRKYDMPHQPNHGFETKRKSWSTTKHLIVQISLARSITGGNYTILMGDLPIEIAVPPGVFNHESILYNNIDPSGTDIVITFEVIPDRVWHRENLDLYIQQPLDFWQLITGTVLKIIGIRGETIEITVPPKTNPNSILRIKGYGVKRDGHSPGDILVKIQATMPESIPDAVVDAIKTHCSPK